MKQPSIKAFIADAVALGALIGLGYVVLLWGAIGEALAGL